MGPWTWLARLVMAAGGIACLKAASRTRFDADRFLFGIAALFLIACPLADLMLWW